jgi:hypothetical protein
VEKFDGAQWRESSVGKSSGDSVVPERIAYRTCTRREHCGDMNTQMLRTLDDWVRVTRVGNPAARSLLTIGGRHYGEH